MTVRHGVRMSAAALTAALAAGALTLGAAGAAESHGWVGGSASELTARAAMPGNTGLGQVQYEPQSIEGVGDYPVGGPADGKLASAGVAAFAPLDEQSATRWVKNQVSPGAHRFGWTFTAPHNTEKFTYYITKNGWDPNAPLDRGDFELLKNVPHDGSAASTNPVHTVDIPADHSGYHVILAVWEISNTVNAFYNVIDVNISGGQTPVDVTAPTAPTGLAATSTSQTSVSLGWTASSDAVGVTGYRVFRNGAQVGTTTTRAYTDSGLTAATAYRYTVRAVDAAGNLSAASTELVVTTQAPPAVDTQAPTAPSGVHSMGTTSSSVDLMWGASSDDTGVVSYRVERATGSGAFAQVAQVTGTSRVDTGLAAATAYRYRVLAVDAAGNVSAPSAVFEVTTAAVPTDPTVPTWNPSGSYVKGQVVQYGGTRYECVQSHTGVGDPNWITAQALWKPLA